MNRIEQIKRLCEETVARYGTRNPFELADRMGIQVVPCPDFQKLEGMYKVILGKRFVFLNGNLRRRRAGQILAHELGHDLLHREMGEDSIVQDRFLVDMTLKPEYEANLFAAQLLVPEAELRELMHRGMSTEEIAQRLRVEEELVKLKILIVNSASCGE